MPGNPHQCREHAKNCWRLAEDARTSEAKAHFEGLAKKWMALATDLEVTKRLLEETIPRPETYTPEECAAEAMEYRRRANAAVTPKERARWVSLANLWEKMAAELRADRAAE